MKQPDHEGDTSLKSVSSDYIPPTNYMAVASFISALVGWGLAFLRVCGDSFLTHPSVTYVIISAWVMAVGTGLLARRQSPLGELAGFGLVAGCAGLTIGMIVVLLGLVLGLLIFLQF